MHIYYRAVVSIQIYYTGSKNMHVYAYVSASMHIGNSRLNYKQNWTTDQ